MIDTVTEAGPLDNPGPIRGIADVIRQQADVERRRQARREAFEAADRDDEALIGHLRRLRSLYAQGLDIGRVETALALLDYERPEEFVIRERGRAGLESFMRQVAICAGDPLNLTVPTEVVYVSGSGSDGLRFRVQLRGPASRLSPAEVDAVLYTCHHFGSVFPSYDDPFQDE